MSETLAVYRPNLPISASGGTVALKAWMEKRLDLLQSVAPPGTDVRRIAALALSEIVYTPALSKCTALSVMRCAMVAAELDITVGKVSGELYPVAYGAECTPIIGYKGMIRLIRRDPLVANVYAEVIYDGEPWRAVRGMHPDLTHEMDLTVQRSDDRIIAAYAVVIFKDGTGDFELLPREDIEKVRNASRSGSSGPWVTWFAEQAKKTAIRRLYKRHQWGSSDAVKAAMLDAADAGEPIEGVFETDAVLEAEAQQETATDRLSKKTLSSAPSEPLEVEDEPLTSSSGQEEAPSGMAEFVALCKTYQRDASTPVKVHQRVRELAPEVLDDKGITGLTPADWAYVNRTASETWGGKK